MTDWNGNLTLPDASIRIMHAALLADGFDPQSFESCAREHGVWGALPSGVAPEIEEKLQRRYFHATGYRPDLWFKLGRRYGLAAFGSFALYMMTAPTLGDLLSKPALARAGFHKVRLNPLRKGFDVIGISYDTQDVSPELREFSTLVSLGCATQLFPELVGPDFHFDLMAIPNDDIDGHLRAICPLPVQTGAESGMLLWHASLSTRPLRSHNAVLHDSYERAFLEKVGARDSRPDFLAEVRALVRRNLVSENVLEDVARALALTPRTLQRRLAAEGGNLRRILEDCRRERVMAWIGEGDVSLAQIAWEAGYADSTALNHAFKRWYGFSPREYRARIGL